jgi:hypothetical protein
MPHGTTRLAIALGWALWLAPLASGAQGAAQQAARPAAAPLERVVKEQIGADEEAKASQQRIDQLDDETQKLLSEYRKALADAESYAAYADQLELQIRSQGEEIDSIDQQLLQAETTAREVSPLMQKMLATLDQFVALDVPFLLEERRKRVAALEDMMTRADVTISEKYRRILEAYQVEMDYGRTIEAYDGRLGEGQDARTVQFLRVGRVALLYQTLDERETGYWDAAKKGWVVDDAYRHGFKEGVAVARKQRAPEMLLVPVPAPKETRS